MRVTSQVKATTRQRILEVARRLFASNGFDAATTRTIAEEAGIASGTLFNYFATKEAILAALASEAAYSASGAFDEEGTGPETLEGDLFAFAAAGLRGLKPLRRHLAALLETTLHPLATSARKESDAFRISHLETVARLARKHAMGELSPLALQLYWTLYTGVLMFWSRDRSPKQEDTLALLDNSLSMFVGWLRREGDTETKAEGEK